MAWTIEYTDTARRSLRKLDKVAARRIVDYLEKRVAGLDDPHELGQALSGPLGARWRYRVGDYRIIADIQGAKLLVLVLQVSHRSTAYR